MKFLLNKSALSGLITLLLLSTGCKEIFSPDISGTTVSVNGPADSLFTNESVVQFWWEEDSDVEKYEILIATPDFNTGLLVFDTLMLGNVLNLSFEGDYAFAWQLRGVNEGSESDSTTGIFFVDQTAPNKATALGMDGDTISAGATDTLRWFARDLPLTDFTMPFGVMDSVYVSRVNDSTQFVYAFSNELGDAQKWPVGTTDIPTTDPGKYWWKVVTIDRAGNAQESDLFYYYVTP